MQRTIIILGMHRSGTSALAGILQQNGVYLGEVSQSNPYNLKGNRESRVIIKLHEQLFDVNGGSWDNPPDSISWDTASYETMRAFISTFEQHEVWGFKDPRTVFTLAEWLHEVPRAELVGIFRNPALVAHSLYKRNGIAIQDGYTLWYRYNQKLIEAHNTRTFPIIEFTPSPQQFLSGIRRLLSEMHFDPGPEVLSFYDPALVHAQESSTHPLPSNVSSLFNTLRQMSLNQSKP